MGFTMGFLDTLCFESDWPEDETRPGDVFQIYDLGCGCSRFCVAGDGSMFQLGYATGTVQLASHHGDLLLVGEVATSIESVIARFAGGQLQWSRKQTKWPAELIEWLLIAHGS